MADPRPCYACQAKACGLRDLRPQCGAAGALRRSGRDFYCAERCGYYLTPGQRRQAA